MKNIFFAICLPFCLTLFSCGNDDESNIEEQEQEQPDYKQIGIITGLNFFDANGSPIGRWNSPNNNPGEIQTYPNPSIGTISVFSLENIEEIWITPAECLIDSITFDISGLSENLTYEVSEIVAIQVKNIPLSEFNAQVNLDLSDLTTGFYRIFYQLETGTILWENLYVDPTVTNIPSFGFLDNLCN